MSDPNVLRLRFNFRSRPFSVTRPSEATVRYAAIAAINPTLVNWRFRPRADMPTE